MKKKRIIFILLLIIIQIFNCNQSKDLSNKSNNYLYSQNNKDQYNDKKEIFLFNIIKGEINEYIKNNKNDIKEYNISNSDLKEVETILYKINLYILKDDIISFNNLLDEQFEIWSSEGEIYQVSNKNLSQNNYFRQIQRTFFSKNVLKKMSLKENSLYNYNGFLLKILNNENDDLKMTFYIDKGENKNYIEYINGVGSKVNKYQGCAFGIRKINGQWKISCFVI